MIKMLTIFSFLLLLVFTRFSMADDIGSSNTGTGDISRCAEDLQTLQFTVRDANNQADAANLKHEDKLRCNIEPAYKNTQGEDCDGIEQTYQDSVDDLDSEFKNIENQLKLVQLACGYDFVLSNTRSQKK